MNNCKEKYFFEKIPFGLFFIIAIVILSIYLRMYRIDTKDIWLDEANTVLISETNLSGIFSKLELDSSPPFFYLILHYWMKLFGQTEAGLRTLSTVFGVLLVIALFFIGRKLFTTEVGIYAALFAAISPIHIMYSQEVRMYTLLSFISVLSMYFFLQFILGGKKTQLFWYTVATTVCLYTHNYGFFLLPAQLLILCIFRRERKTLITWLVGTGCVILAYLVWLSVFLNQLKNGTHYAWIQYFWERYGFWGSLLQSLKSFSPGGTQPPYVALNNFTWAPFLPVVFISILLVFGVVQFVIKKQKFREYKTATFWLFMYFSIPLIIAGLVSIIFSPVYVAGRCDQLVFPSLCIFAAFSISAIKPRGLRYVAIIILLVFSFKTMGDYYRSNLKYGDKKIASVIRRNLQSGDALLFTSLTRASVEYYLREEKSQLNLFSYPLEMADHMGNQDIEDMLKDSKRLIREADFLEKKIRHSSRSRRLFILWVPNPVNEFLKAQFKKNIPAKQIKVIGKFRQSLRNEPVEIILIDFGGESLD